MTQVSTHPADPPGSVGQATRPGPFGPFEPHEPTGPVDRVMDWLIRKLAWSRLSEPKVAVGLSAAGLLLGMLLGATAPSTPAEPGPAADPAAAGRYSSGWLVMA